MSNEVLTYELVKVSAFSDAELESFKHKRRETLVRKYDMQYVTQMNMNAVEYITRYLRSYPHRWGEWQVFRCESLLRYSQQLMHHDPLDPNPFVKYMTETIQAHYGGRCESCVYYPLPSTVMPVLSGMGYDTSRVHGGSSVCFYKMVL